TSHPSGALVAGELEVAGGAVAVASSSPSPEPVQPAARSAATMTPVARDRMPPTTTTPFVPEPWDLGHRTGERVGALDFEGSSGSAAVARYPRGGCRR